MHLDTLITPGMLVVMGIFILTYGYSFWQQWRTGDSKKHAQLLAAAKNDIVTLVKAAEQVHGPGAGKTKFSWVMNILVRQYPNLDWDNLTHLLEAVVYDLNQQRKPDA